MMGCYRGVILGAGGGKEGREESNPRDAIFESR